MDSCLSCGATLAAGQGWCGQCYAPKGQAPQAVATLTRPMTKAAPLQPLAVKTRWRKTPTTFGPTGRILATIALVVPEIVFIIVGVFTGGLTLAGIGIWGFVIMPWGLRDTWKAGIVPPV